MTVIIIYLQKSPKKTIYLKYLFFREVKMPYLTVHCNAGLRNKNTAEFLNAATELVAGELKKPKSYVVVELDSNPGMAFGGNSTGRGALIEMKSVGFENKDSLARLLTEFVYDRFEGLDLKNINIWFVDMPHDDVSVGGRLL